MMILMMMIGNILVLMWNIQGHGFSTINFQDVSELPKYDDEDVDDTDNDGIASISI